MTINLIQPEIPGAKVASVWQRSTRFITCLFCGLRGRQAGDSPLCSNCLIDPIITRAAILREIDAIQAQELQALATWDAVREPSQADWDRIQAQADAPDYAARCADHRARATKYGRLLDAQASYTRTVEALAERRDALERALLSLED